MLFRMTSGAKRNGVPIAWLPPDTTVGACTHMGGIRWRCFTAAYAGKQTDKS